jgi:hypothetical protein
MLVTNSKPVRQIRALKARNREMGKWDIVSSKKVKRIKG